MIVNRNGLSDPTWPVSRGLWPCAIDSTAVCVEHLPHPLLFCSTSCLERTKESNFNEAENIHSYYFSSLDWVFSLKANVSMVRRGVADCHVTSPVHPFAWSIPTIDGHHREVVRKKVCSQRRAGRRRSLLEVRIVSRSAVHISETQAPG